MKNREMSMGEKQAILRKKSEKINQSCCASNGHSQDKNLEHRLYKITNNVHRVRVKV